MNNEVGFNALVSKKGSDRTRFNTDSRCLQAVPPFSEKFTETCRKLVKVVGILAK